MPKKKRKRLKRKLPNKSPNTTTTCMDAYNYMHSFGDRANFDPIGKW